MAELLREDSGLPKPQYETEDGSAFEALKGKEGAIYVRTKDGHNETIGSKTDAEAATGNGSLIALIKNLRTRLANLETLLSGGISVSFPQTQQVTGTVNVGNFPATQNVNVQNNVKIDDTTPVKVDLNNVSSVGYLDVYAHNHPDETFDVNITNMVLPVLAFPSTGCYTANVTASAANTPQLVYDIIPLTQNMEQPYEYIIKASDTNTGKIFILSPQSPPGEGIPLSPGQEFRFKYGFELYFSAENAGDSIHVFLGTLSAAMMMGGGAPGGGGGGGPM
jgi:hypothetical protein